MGSHSCIKIHWIKSTSNFIWRYYPGYSIARTIPSPSERRIWRGNIWWDTWDKGLGIEFSLWILMSNDDASLRVFDKERKHLTKHMGSRERNYLLNGVIIGTRNCKWQYYSTKIDSNSPISPILDLGISEPFLWFNQSLKGKKGIRSGYRSCSCSGWSKTSTLFRII